MKKILSVTLSLIIASCFFMGGNPAQNFGTFAADISAYDEYFDTQTVYNKLISMKKDYPEGMTWANDNRYAWKGGIYSAGYGCAGFAFLMSDSIFGNFRARKHTDISRVKVGDILRLDYDAHSVIVLKKEGSIVTVAEGNYNSSIHWGRKIDLSGSSCGFTYVLTRYPKKGDVNGDNTINPLDASLALSEYAVLSTASSSNFDGRQNWAAEIDGNNQIDPSDASYILSFYAYLSTTNDKSEIDIREWKNI